MSYDFPIDVHAQISQHLASGDYISTDEVLRAALRALKLHDQEVAAIRDGIADMEAGRTISFRAFDREFRTRKNLPHNK